MERGTHPAPAMLYPHHDGDDKPARLVVEHVLTAETTPNDVPFRRGYPAPVLAPRVAMSSTLDPSLPGQRLIGSDSVLGWTPRVIRPFCDPTRRGHLTFVCNNLRLRR